MQPMNVQIGRTTTNDQITLVEAVIHSDNAVLKPIPSPVVVASTESGILVEELPSSVCISASWPAMV